MSEVQLRLNLGAKAEVHARIDKAVRQVFEKDILPEAASTSPVTPQGEAYNQQKFDMEHHRPGTQIDPVRLKGTGHNRQGLDLEFTQTGHGQAVKLFGQSGYSGYLEVGTSKMRAQPYIYPAWLKFKNKIFELIKGV